jgi:hypothetical protein
MNNLYNTDIVLWAERQAKQLRRMANGERVNDQVGWPNIVQEIESVSNEERKDERQRRP